MTNFTVYEKGTGRILRTGSCVAEDFEHQPVPAGCEIVELESDREKQYIINGTAVDFPTRPSEWHEWDWLAKAWLESPDAVERFRVKRRTEINLLREQKNLDPIEYQGALFDADRKAQGNVSSWMVAIANGATVPTGFTWRDYDNVDHPADADFICGLGAALVSRGSALYQTSWNHKAAIDSLNTILEIEQYDLTIGWP